MSTKTIPTAHTYGEEIDNIGIAQTTYRGRDARLVSGSPITPFDVEWHHHRGGEVIDVYDVRSHVGGTYPAGAWVVEFRETRTPVLRARARSYGVVPHLARLDGEDVLVVSAAELREAGLRDHHTTWERRSDPGDVIAVNETYEIVERDVRGYMTVLREITR